MSNEFIGMMRAEIASIERELEGNPKYIRLTSLRRALATYGLTENDSKLATSPKFENRAKEQALAVALEMVSVSSGLPIPTRDIHDRLLSENIILSGKDPKSNLSAILSDDDRFKANGRSGWTLVSAEAEADLDLGEVKVVDVPPIDEFMKAHEGKELKGVVTYSSGNHRNKRTEADYNADELM